MKKKRQFQQSIMQQAIQKASQLINLLQKQNQQLKKRYQNIQKQNYKKQKQNNELINLNDELQKQLIKIQIKLQEYNHHVQELQLKIKQKQQQLDKKIKINKQLHQKIAELNINIKNKNKNNNQERIKMMSLANQNQYLLKKIHQKQNNDEIWNRKIQEINQIHSKQIKQLVKVKQAFARKYQEIKADNIILTQKAAQYKQHLIQLQSRSNIIINKPILNMEYQDPYSRKVKSIEYEAMIDKILHERLSITPQKTYEGKLQQLNSFISYRLGHIQKMCQLITKKLQLKEWNKLQNLKDLNTTCLRINSYLCQLINKNN